MAGPGSAAHGAAGHRLYHGASRFERPTGSIAAASVVVTPPIVLVVLAFQRRIVSGRTAGAVKG